MNDIMASLHPQKTAQALVLVVEDEPMLLMTYEDALDEAGARWISAASLSEAMSIFSLDVDVAILDIRLGNEKVFPLAIRLMDAGIPFLFCSGTASDMTDGVFEEILLINKPANASMVVSKALSLARRAHA